MERDGVNAHFVAVVRTSLAMERKRVAPYAASLLFAGNAALWWYRGPAYARGLAPNDEQIIAGMCAVFAFMTLPLFVAVLMGGTLLRDVEDRIDPLVFSTPVGDAPYVVGKFVAAFAVLVCCEASFVLALMLLQWGPGDVHAFPPRVLPFARHFVGIIVVASAPLAALCFAASAVTQNAKAPYAVALMSYVLYGAWQVDVLSGVSPRMRVVLDPLLMNWVGTTQGGLTYSAEIIANRAAMIIVTSVIIWGVCIRFAKVLRVTERRPDRGVLSLRLGAQPVKRGAIVAQRPVSRARFSRWTLENTLDALRASIGVELRLLRAERGIMIALPLTCVLCGIELQGIADAGSPAYARALYNPLLLMVLAVALFYTGEALHRNEIIRTEPLAWSAPAPDTVLLLGTLLSSLVLSMSVMTIGASCAAMLQAMRTASVPMVLPYAQLLIVILLPTAAFATSIAITVHTIVRERYAGHVSLLGACIGLYFLHINGYTGWLYNVALIGRWTFADFSNTSATRAPLLWQRIYVIGLSVAALAIAHLCFHRPASRQLRQKLPRGSRHTSLIVLLAASAVCVIIGEGLAK